MTKAPPYGGCDSSLPECVDTCIPAGYNDTIVHFIHTNSTDKDRDSREGELERTTHCQ